MNKRKTIGIVTICGLTAFGLTLSTLAFSNYKTSARLKASDYTLTLDDDNGLSGSNVTTTQSITTDSGAYQVEFGYTNCSSLSGGHAVIEAGGLIVNNDHIRSIYSLVANFSTSGSLLFRVSYDGATWGGYTTMVSAQEYSLGSNPYYVEFSTDGSNSVNLTSVQYSYTCLENSAANEDGSTTGEEYQFEKVTSALSDWSGEYMVVYEYSDTVGYAFAGSYSNSSYETVTIEDGVISTTPNTTVILEAADSAYTAQLAGSTNAGYYIYGTDGSNYLNITSTADSTINVQESTEGFGLYWGEYPFRLNDGSNGYTATWAFKFYKASSSLNSEQSLCKLYKKVYLPTYDTPVDENGFTAIDANKDSYTTASVFDSDNGLTVQATFTDGSTQTLSKGTDGYSYTITNSSGTAIDTSEAFGTEDVYTLTVNYSNYIPVQITLNVGIYSYLTGITANMSTVAFNTADVLSDSISSILTADLSYNVSSLDTTVSYSNFGSYDIEATLIDPNGVTYSMSTAFGTAGTWTLKVASTEDSSIADTVSLTVSAIAVVDITLDNSALTIYVGNTAQLTATVNPTNATNQGIIWASDDETVATVDENGLVTAVKVGTATVTATSSDGGYTATCAITVKKQTTTTATITAAGSGTENSPASISTSSFTTNNITLSDASSSGYVYYSSDTSFRLGKGSGVGSLTFTFDSTVITGITLHAAVYGSDSSSPVKITTSANTTGETVSVTSSSSSDYVTEAFASDTTESTTITVATTTNGSRIYFYGLTLTCGVADPVYPTAISLEDSTCNVGYTTQLTPTFTPSDTNQTTLTWASSNTSVATVSDSGLVTGIAAGSATITATGEDEDGNDVVGTCTVTVTTVAVTGVSLNKTSSDLSLSAQLTLEATVAPTNATNKDVTWSSSDSSIASVTSAGVVTGVALGTATITVTTDDGSYTASCEITVVEQATDDYTIMIYMCGSNLESSYGYSTGDIKEILNVSGQPDGVNIIIETGGASSWKSTYGISASYLERYHVENKSLVRDSRETKASMGLSSTFQSFLEWGMTEYPAKKTGVIMWNHGGAMDGCCFDENYSNDPLTNSEANTAYEAAFSSVGRSENLEWIGYDCCLMAVQDVAEFNSHYFNYMVASQETEGGYGWDYDGGWLSSLYNNPTGIETSTLLTEVCEDFIADNSSESTLSALDLTKMSAYKTAFENLASGLSSIITSSSTWSTFATMVNKCKKFGYDSDYTSYNSGYVYDVFDVQDFITRGASSYSSLSSYWTALQTAFDNIIVCSKYTSDYSGSNGLNLFCPISGINSTSCYSTSQTNFTTWRTLCINYGDWY